MLVAMYEIKAELVPHSLDRLCVPYMQIHTGRGTSIQGSHGILNWAKLSQALLTCHHVRPDLGGIVTSATKHGPGGFSPFPDVAMA